MVDQILFYISAAQDASMEREVLARITTEIPVTLGWKIVQSPVKGERLDPESIVNADYHVLVLGSDIRAPIGVELMIARQAGRNPVYFKKTGVMHTPAAEDFIRLIQSYSPWNTYKDNQELRFMFLKSLGDHILDRADYYALRAEEYDGLLKWREDLDKKPGEPVEEFRGGAGDSSIVFSRERYIPSEGILLGNPEEEGKNNKKPK